MFLGEYGVRARTVIHKGVFECKLLAAGKKCEFNPRALVGLRMALQCASGEFHTVKDVMKAIRAAIDAIRSEARNA